MKKLKIGMVLKDKYGNKIKIIDIFRDEALVSRINKLGSAWGYFSIVSLENSYKFKESSKMRNKLNCGKCGQEVSEKVMKNISFEVGNIVAIKVDGQRNQKILAKLGDDIFALSEPAGFDRIRELMTKFELIDAGYEVVMQEK